IFVAYIIWPIRFDLKRVAMLYVPATVAFALLVPLVYYGALHAKRQNVEHAIFVFDLAGISHFTGENQFPVTWSADENAMLVGPCYRAGDWDDYWTRQPCLFVMKKLDGEKLFGSPALRQAWLHALAAHPLAYLEHRAAVVYMATFIPVGVAGDFRYALWAVLAGLAGVMVVAVRDRASTDHAGS